MRIGMQTGAGSGKWKKILAFFLTLSIVIGTGSTAYAGTKEMGSGFVKTAAPADAGMQPAAGKNGAGQNGGITYLGERTLRSGDADDGADSRLFMRSTLEYECRYGDQLTGESRRIYDAFVKKWGGGNTGNITYYFSTQLPYSTANVELTYQNTQMAYDAFVYDYPEVFWLQDASVSIGRNDSTNLLVSVIVKGNERYPGARSEISRFNQAVKNEAAVIRSLLPKGADRYTIVKMIHDHVCEMAEYDYLGINYRHIYGKVYYDTAHTAAGIFLKDGIVVCEGYAKAFKILCRQFGIDCALIIGNAGGDHMWNYVKMDDGKWYLVDATWDDQGSAVSDTYLLAGSMSYGYDNNLIWQERQTWTDFSGSGAKNFVLPVLSTSAYEKEEHQWVKISETAATCHSYAVAEYRCELCQATKKEIIGPETDHKWGKYKSNQDATWEEDGTKTARCQYGCGETRTTVDKGSRLTPRLKVNISNLCLQVGQSTSAVKVTLVRGDKVVSWRSDKPWVVSVNSQGKITAGLEPGTAVITIITLSGITKKIPVTVQEKVVETTSITGLSPKVTLQKGEKLQLAPMVEPVTSRQKVTYTSSDEKVAAVTAKGVITAKRSGTAKITVRSGKKMFKVTVKVKKS